MTEQFHQRTTYAVWEITLKCNLACSHCGSRAGPARTSELSTAEALDVVDQLAEVGINEVTLIGGEAYLRKDWLEIAAAITAKGMLCTITTGGLGISPETARKMKEAGITGTSVSIDGLREAHDAVRGVPGSWDACFRTMRILQEAGIPVTVNSQVNRRTWLELEALYPLLRDAGMHSWQYMLTVPMGNAADNPELLLQPYDLVELFPRLAALSEQATADGVRMWPGNNIGYYSPYDQVLHGRDPNGPVVYYGGCEAGTDALGIEADGTIKGCPSLPTKAYTGANIRDMRLADIMADTEPLQFNKIPRFTEESVAHMWGFCGSCRFKKLCRGGCSWTAHVFFGKRGNNPYCHHRALQHEAQGYRERLVKKSAAPGTPFDHGIFESVIEPKDAPLPERPWDPASPSSALAVEVRDDARPPIQPLGSSLLLP